MICELITTRKCENCGQTITADQPFIMGKWIGMQSKPHGCPDGYDIVCAIPRDKVIRQQYVDFFHEVSGSLELDT
jgi:hypothetical protein